ncbi:hypothetical protein S40288_05080 [Stachybotrys chartarum IBT 40288]|nr:hypothetical protein S40288_05080 [Stachybotrys chartarum IBT 40288]
MASHMNTAERPKVQTAKWGAACGTCSTAKAKCLRSNTAPGSKCDRCERLFKECTEQVHRPRKKRTVKQSRTAQIERKLNGLVNLLKASGGLSAADLDAETLSLTRELESASASQQSTPGSPSSTYSGSSPNPWAIPETYNSCAPASCICRPESGDAPPPPDSDETLLGVYRNELQRIHPFVVVPPSVTAAELNATRPFLMASIRMVASFRSLRSMRAQMYYLMKHISDHMLIRSDRSLDLLLGILVIVGWYQYHCFMHAQMSNLIALAVSLVVQLNLDRPTSFRHYQNRFLRPSELKTRTNEERRAYAGAWFMASASLIGSWKVEPMRYTEYLKQCISELELGAEYESDAKLVYLVRIQHLTERITHLHCPDTAAEETFSLPRPPRAVYLHLNTATLRLHELPILDSRSIASITESIHTASPGEPSAIDQLYMSRSAIVNWFDYWQTIPVCSYYTQTTTVAAQLIYAIGTLGRWARLTSSPTVLQAKSSLQASLHPRGMYPAPASAITSPSPAQDLPATPASNPSQDKEPCEMASSTFRMDDDPALPSVVAVLQSQLHALPDLALDIPGMMSGICTRLDAANTTLEAASTDDGGVVHNVWSMGAVRLRLARAKLERWTELVSERMSTFSLDEPGHTFLDTAGGAGQRGGGMIPDDLGGFWSAEMSGDDGLMQNPNGGMVWTGDLLQGMDPSMLFDPYWDWESVAANSVETTEQ